MDILVDVIFEIFLNVVKVYLKSMFQIGNLFSVCGGKISMSVFY